MTQPRTRRMRTSGSYALALAAACATQPVAEQTRAPLTAASGPAASQAEHCAHHAPPPATAPLPGRSLYHSTAALTDQRGQALGLAQLRGQPVLIGMFYSSCTSVCPMLIAQLQRIERTLPADVRSGTRVLLVSLDPERDTPERLLALAKRHGVDESRWRFTRTSESGVREIAALLGVSYRRLPDGEISHSPLIALVDQDGVVVERLVGAFTDPSTLVAAVTALSQPRP